MSVPHEGFYQPSRMSQQIALVFKGVFALNVMIKYIY